jgi:hypothetical protein
VFHLFRKKFGPEGRYRCTRNSLEYWLNYTKRNTKKSLQSACISRLWNGHLHFSRPKESHSKRGLKKLEQNTEKLPLERAVGRFVTPRASTYKIANEDVTVYVTGPRRMTLIHCCSKRFPIALFFRYPRITFKTVLLQHPRFKLSSFCYIS